MREILFRGKRIDNGEWVYGSLISWADGTCSIESGKLDTPMWCVIPETVGQYTGLCDKNGKKIFEGDICQIKNHRLIDDLPFAIEWEDSIYNGWVWRDFDEIGAKDSFTTSVASICEVIGNIHDPGRFGGGL